MDMQKIPIVPDRARAMEAALAAMRSRKATVAQASFRDEDRKEREIGKECARAFARSIRRQFSRIIEIYPRLDELSDMEYELLALDMDIDAVRKALGAIRWAIKMNDRFEKETLRKIASNPLAYNNLIGRMDSVLSQIDDALLLVEQSRKVLRELPRLSGDPLIAIAGFPNVGKSTLLAQLTDAKPMVDSYPFTTKGLNLGVFSEGLLRAQLVDTPGTLNREKSNTIEDRANILLKHVDGIVYVFDPTLSYPRDDQVALFERIKQEHDVLMIVHISKTDIAQDIFSEYERTTTIDDLRGALSALVVRAHKTGPRSSRSPRRPSTIEG